MKKRCAAIIALALLLCSSPNDSTDHNRSHLQVRTPSGTTSNSRITDTVGGWTTIEAIRNEKDSADSVQIIIQDSITHRVDTLATYRAMNPSQNDTFTLAYIFETPGTWYIKGQIYNAGTVDQLNTIILVMRESPVRTGKGPKFKLQDQIKNLTRVTDSTATLSYTITDADGVDSVYYTINRNPGGTIQKAGSNTYRINYNLAGNYGKNVIRIYAGNGKIPSEWDSTYLVLIYNTVITPIVADTPVNNSKAKVATLHWVGGTDADGDTVACTVRYGHSRTLLDKQLTPVFNTSSAFIGDLNNGDTVYWCVHANSYVYYQDSVKSDTSMFVLQNAAPISSKVVGIDNSVASNIRIFWTMSPEQDFQTYRIYHALDTTDVSSLQWILDTTLTTRTDTSLVIGSLNDSTSYAFKVLTTDVFSLTGSSVPVTGSTKQRHWLPSIVLQVPRKCLRLDTLNGALWAIGGTNGVSQSSIEQFDSTNQTWTIAPVSLTSVRSLFSTGVLKGVLYICGGKEAPVSLEAYKTVTNEWVTRKMLPVPRIASQIIAIGSKLYVFGGYNQNGVLDNFDMYETATNNWFSKGNMPLPRAYFGAANVRNKIYLLGGVSSDTTVMLSSVDIFDLSQDTWSVGNPLPYPVSHFATAVMNEKIYIIGGHGHSYNVAEYNPIIDKWSMVNSTNSSHVNASAAVYGNALYVAGGNNDNAPDAAITDVEVFR